VAAFARAGAFQGNRQRQPLTGLSQCPGILLPGIAIEIDGQQIAGFIREQGIQAHDKLAPQVIPTREVVANHVIGDRQEAPIGTFGALYAGLIA
jgi:hypothetical protein